MAYAILDVVPEDVQEPHVSQHVKPSSMQKHRSKDRDHGRSNIVSNTPKKPDRHKSVVKNERLTPAAQAQLEKPDQNVDHDQSDVYKREGA